ncbi:MAG: hypothetical protein KF812_02350 [Fimbriimonadaceae bacterium]|nr:hypothetical protein [Fimbriimonadaceae bacterium]
MAKFRFRLDVVLRLREREEELAKNAYRAATARRIEAESTIDLIREKRRSVLVGVPASLAARIALPGLLERIDDDEHASVTIADLLQQEEEAALRRYVEAKQSAEALRKLREGRHAEWQLAEDRAEQQALDEWAVQRRAA